MGAGFEDVGAGSLYKGLLGTLSLYENAAVLTHQSTVCKDGLFLKYKKLY